ncbi:MAG: type II toxin-antitoxin system HipA family toxin [Kiritimatiellia bacterium]
MNTLSVYLRSEPVGTLAQDESGMLQFTYASEWLDRDDATPLSRMLPLSPAPYAHKVARCFFAGILPEQGPRRVIAGILGISEGNDFAMLERIGGECAGAISLFPEGQSPLPVESRVQTLDERDLVAIMDELPRRPLLAGEEGIRLSLAGAQDKLPVFMDADRIALPLGNTPSTHILKPEPSHFPGLVANEAFCMDLARRVGLTVAGTTVRMIGATPCIVVSRYDRESGPDGTIRLHQEDLCQALGRPPERKYQQEGGPTVRECVALLREWSTTPVLDILAFVDALIFNLLIGNADAHGKNYSMIYAAGTRRLAPLYDLVSTIAWPELSTRLAMNIGPGKHANDLNPAHFRSLAEECDLGWPMIRERVRILADKMFAAVDNRDATDGFSLPAMHPNIADMVLDRCKRMLEQIV